jgi:hypothetical protein
MLADQIRHRVVRAGALAGVLACWAGQPLNAQSPPYSPDPASGPGQSPGPGQSQESRQSYQVPRFTTPPKIDGVIAGEAAWEIAATVTSFVETDPGANVDPPVKTIGYVGYDENFLYFAIHSFDPHPEKIRANFNMRDRAATGDYAAIHLDTRGDGDTFYTFGGNPRGVPIDFMTRRGQTPNMGYDGMYEVAGRVIDDGWVLEGRIPFKGLLPGAMTRPMGFAFIRVYPREIRRRIVSVRKDYRNACIACQFDRLTGIEGIKGGQTFEMTPAVMQSAADDGAKGAFNDNRPWPSLDAAYNVSSNIRFELTANPNYSQIDPDGDQLDINTRYALSFPEKRMFFGGGMDTFNSMGVASGLTIGVIQTPVVSGSGGQPLMLFYPRAIADPDFGAKLLGSAGSQEFGVMVARDDASGVVVPNGNGSSLFQLPSASTATVARYRSGIANVASVGAVVTNLETQGGRSSVVAGDFQLQPDKKIDITGQFAHSSADDLGSADLARTWGTGTRGANAFSLQARAGDQRTYNLQAGYTDVGEDFRSDLGYVPQNDLRTFDTSGTYQFFPSDNPVMVRGGPAMRYVRSTNHRGQLMEESYFPGIIAVLKHQIWLRVHGQVESTTFNDVRFDNMKRVLFLLDGRPVHVFERLAVYYFKGDKVDFANTRLGTGSELTFISMMQPHPRLITEVSAVRETLARQDTGTDVFTANTLGAKAVGFISSRLFGRVIVQRRVIDRDPLQYFLPVSARERGTNVFALVSYSLNPKTMLHVGYDDVGFRLAPGGDQQHPGRSFFVKLGYTFRP